MAYYGPDTAIRDNRFTPAVGFRRPEGAVYGADAVRLGADGRTLTIATKGVKPNGAPRQAA